MTPRFHSSRDAENRTEEWRPVVGFEGCYKVSNLGRIFSIPRTTIVGKRSWTIGGSFLTHGIDSKGYPRVTLSIAGKSRRIPVHRIVGEAFVEGKSEINHEIAHLDGDRSNPLDTNLKWVSTRENQSHRRLHGTDPRGERSGRAKLSEVQVREIKRALKTNTGPALALKYGVHFTTISNIKTGRSWSHVD